MLGALKDRTGITGNNSLCIDHWVFRLHYKFTVLLLMCFCTVVSLKLYLGDPIKCAKNTLENIEVVDVYCLTTGTYTIRSAFNSTTSSTPHPGITTPKDEDDFRFHTYYQWIGIILFLQALSFYFPHWLWKVLESSRMAGIVDHESEGGSKREHIVDCLRARWGANTLYTLQYCSCELLCLLNVIFQMVFLNALFEGAYMSYGTKVIRYLLNPKTALNPFDLIFPKVTACSYSYYGTRGKMAKLSFLCVMPVNSLYEKIFLILWVWFVFLEAVTLLAIVFKGVTFPFRRLRVGLLHARFRTIPEESLEDLVSSGNLGDWFFIYLLAQNVDEKCFSSIVNSMLARSREIKEAQIRIDN